MSRPAEDAQEEAPSPVADQPSLCTASLLGKALAVGFGRLLFLTRFSAAATPTCFDAGMTDDGQLVRSVAFLEIPNGPVCLVSAGDNKMINLYNVSNKGEGGAASEKDFSKPCFSYGPHTKRITHVIASQEGVVIFADKFGEVYRLGLTWSPEHRVEVHGNGAAPASFLLQHFSIFSALFLTSPVLRAEGVAGTEDEANVLPRRLITCDKDNHVRVSRFPESYCIEQYLWGKEKTQSVVTAITEIPLLQTTGASLFGKTTVTTADGGVSLVMDAARGSTQELGAQTYLLLGFRSGAVALWCGRNGLPQNSTETVFTLLQTFPPEGSAGVVGLCCAVANRDTNGVTRHPDDTPMGFFVAHEGSCEVLFYPILCSAQSTLRASREQMRRVEVPHPVLALRRCSAAGAVVLTRAGTLHFVELCPAQGLQHNKSLESQEFTVQIRSDYALTDMEGLLKRHCFPAEGISLANIHLWAQWENEVLDPRARKRPHTEDDEDDDS